MAVVAGKVSRRAARRAERESPAQGSRTLLWSTVLVALCSVASAFSVIHSTHACRELYAQLQTLESLQWYLQEDYGRLLLEQSTWASHYRVERVARKELGMAPPSLDRYSVIRP